MTINFGRYAIVYFLTALGFAVFSALLEAFTGLSGGGGAATVVPAFVAAMSEGQRWVRENGGPMPEKAALWQGAWRCTLAAAAVNAITPALQRSIARSAGVASLNSRIATSCLPSTISRP